VLDNLVCKYKVEEHDLVKESFLTLFEYADQTKKSKRIGNLVTDYFSSFENGQPAYAQLAEQVLQKYIATHLNKCRINARKINMLWWFNQYYKNGEHEWHIHGNTSFALVYFVELPHNELGTQLYGIDLPVEEGDVLLFPGIIPHRSAPNKFDQRKSSLVANISAADANII